VTSYTVIWEPPAENNLAAVWLASATRPAVTQAAHHLDQGLATAPFSMGFRRNASVNRTAVVGPLGIDYEIIEDDKQFRVLRVWSVE
jgi:hypothetical protein